MPLRFIFIFYVSLISHLSQFSPLFTVYLERSSDDDDDDDTHVSRKGKQVKILIFFSSSDQVERKVALQFFKILFEEIEQL